MTTGVWTISVGGIERKWIKLELHRMLVLNAPTTFYAEVELDLSNPVYFMDEVDIKRDGTTEWKGYVEGIEPYWDGTSLGGKYIQLTGRDVTMILWKKYDDDFSNFASKTAGMFGTVDPVSLLHFILHTPKSDIGIDYPYNKEGWGLDFSKSIDVERCNATWADPSLAKFELGSPEWCFSRQRGYGWSNTGRETLTEYTPASTVTTATLDPDWTVVGPAPSPYIDGNTPNQTSYVNYLKSSGVIPIGQTLLFNITPFSFSGSQTLKAVTVTVTFYNHPATIGSFNVYYWSVYLGQWVQFVWGDNDIGTGNRWVTKIYDISQYLTVISDLESADLQIKIETTNPWSWIVGGVDYFCQIAYVGMDIIQGDPNGTQTENDAFEIIFKPELLIPIGSTYVVDTNGLVGEYLLNEGTGTVIHDYSGTNSNATAHNITWVMGPLAPLVLFSGNVNSYIDCGSSFTWLTGYNSMSIDCWLDIIEIGPFVKSLIINKPNQCIIEIDEAGILWWKLYFSGTGWELNCKVGNAILQNERAHLQAVYDGFSMNLYVNNNLVKTLAKTGYLDIDGTQPTYFEFGPMYGYLADVCIYNRAIYPTITALYFECRANTAAYARNYTVEYLVNGVYAVIPNTYPAMPVTGNTTQDILISFPPISAQKVRIRLTESVSGIPWAISQIYVYKAEYIKYKPYLDTGEIDPSEPRDASPYIYKGGPYIKAFSNQLTGGNANPIGPLNVSRQRLNEAINYVVGLCSSIVVGESDVVGFSPFEWWMSYDSNNTFNIKNQKGSDKTASIIFKMDPSDPANTNLGMVDYDTFIDDTVQNVYVVGQGEQKHLQDCSIWVKSINATGLATNGQPLNTAENIVRTFFEDVVQDKTVIINDSNYPAVGNILGCGNLTINAMPRVQLKLQLAKDQYTSMQYDVGDIVQVYDTVTGIGYIDLTLGKYRITNIDITVSKDTGEDVKITLGYPNYKYEDELQTMYRNMKSYGIIGAFNSDWTAEGTDKTLLDANLISSSSQYNASAQNDKMAQNIPYDGNLWRTTSSDYDADPSSPPTITTTIDSHFLWSTTNQWFGMMANADGSIHDLIAVLIGNLIQYYNPSDPNADPTTHLVSGADAANINMFWNPHLVVDLRVLDGTYIDLANANWVYNHWNAGSGTSAGDYCRIGIASQDGSVGFWFMIVKNGSVTTPALFDVYCQWALPDGTTNFNAEDFNCNNSTLGDGFVSPNGSYMQTIIALQKYKIEIITQSDPTFIATNTPNVQFNLYTYKSILTTDNAGVELTYVQLTYPTLGICVNSQIYNMVVKPLYCEFYNLAQTNPSSGSPSGIYFYNWTTNWIVKQIEVTQ
jgi:hypothetical protein